MSKGEGLVTHGPVYRPTEFRELRRDPLAVENLPSRYSPGPAPIPLDSRLKDQGRARPSVEPVAPIAPIAPIARTPVAQVVRPQRRFDGSIVKAVREVHADSIAGRAFAVLSDAADWMSAHEIFLACRERGWLDKRGPYHAIKSGKDISVAIGWHVAKGRIHARKCDRMEACSKYMPGSAKAYFFEYRLNRQERTA